MERTVRLHQRNLVGFVWGHVRDEATAHDIVQEGFLRLWQQEAVDTDEHAKRWLYMTCRNLAMDRVKQRGRRVVLLNTHAPSLQQQQTSTDPQSVALAAERHAPLIAGVANLPPRQQEVVRLRLQAELPYKEIAAIMDTTPSNVGALMHAATKRLRQDLETVETRSQAEVNG